MSLPPNTPRFDITSPMLSPRLGVITPLPFTPPQPSPKKPERAEDFIKTKVSEMTPEEREAAFSRTFQIPMNRGVVTLPGDVVARFRAWRLGATFPFKKFYSKSVIETFSTVIQMAHEQEHWWDPPPHRFYSPQTAHLYTVPDACIQFLQADAAQNNAPDDFYLRVAELAEEVQAPLVLEVVAQFIFQRLANVPDTVTIAPTENFPGPIKLDLDLDLAHYCIFISILRHA